MTLTVLLVDPPGGALAAVAPLFHAAVGHGCAVELLPDAEALLGRMRADRGYDLLLIDDAEGQAIAGRARELDGEVPIVLVAEHGDVARASRVIAAGATDFLVLGDQLEDRVHTLIGKVRQVARLIESKRALARQHHRMLAAERERYELLGSSPQMDALRARIQRVAPIPRPVLILGERGTGKELIGRAIHGASGGSGPIVVINCAAFSDALLENELFGHEKGAFTGADHVAQGRFEQASRGTLFLDEIGNMSLPFQQKILRVVEYGTFCRVGGTEERRTDARIIAATNADLDARIAAGEFLRDLYDRLSFEIIRVPPLRERPDDIELLAHQFLGRFMAEIPSLSGKRLAPAAIEALRHHPFPGNVRELKHVIERAAYRDTGPEIGPADLDLPAEGPTCAADGFHSQVDAFSRGLLRTALAETGGNRAAAARLLGLSYHQLRYLLRKLGP